MPRERRHPLLSAWPLRARCKSTEVTCPAGGTPPARTPPFTPEAYVGRNRNNLSFSNSQRTESERACTRAEGEEGTGGAANQGGQRCSHLSAPKGASLTFPDAGTLGWVESGDARVLGGLAVWMGRMWGQLGRGGLGPIECFPSRVSVRRSLGVGGGKWGRCPHPVCTPASSDTRPGRDGGESGCFALDPTLAAAGSEPSRLCPRTVGLPPAPRTAHPSPPPVRPAPRRAVDRHPGLLSAPGTARDGPMPSAASRLRLRLRFRLVRGAGASPASAGQVR